MNTKHIILSATIVAVGALTFAGAHPVAEAASFASTSHTLSLFDTPLTLLQDFPGDDCGNCQQDCGPGNHLLQEHTDPDFNTDRRWGEENHGCQSGWCSAAHPETVSCSTGGSELAALSDELWATVMDGTVEDLPWLVSELGEAVSYNPTRRALQVRGCNDQIMLSVPLTRAQAELFIE